MSEVQVKDAEVREIFSPESCFKINWQENLRHDAFHQFSKLPLELREKIWQYTWPGPRLIEVGRYRRDAASFFEDDDDRPFYLRIMGPLSVIHSLHTKQKEVPQQRFPPVSLFVCHESRLHTLRYYRLIQYVLDSGCSFYCDPYIDVLWFNYEFTGHDVNEPPRSQESMDNLCKRYGPQLDLFKNVLIEEMFWDPQSGNQEYLGRLLGIKTILITDTSHQDSNIPLGFDDEDSQRFEAAAEKEYSNFMIQHPAWPLKSIEYLDRDSKKGFKRSTSPRYRYDHAVHPLDK